MNAIYCKTLLCWVLTCLVGGCGSDTPTRYLPFKERPPLEIAEPLPMGTRDVRLAHATFVGSYTEDIELLSLSFRISSDNGLLKAPNALINYHVRVNELSFDLPRNLDPDDTTNGFTLDFKGSFRLIPRNTAIEVFLDADANSWAALAGSGLHTPTRHINVWALFAGCTYRTSTSPLVREIKEGWTSSSRRYTLFRAVPLVVDSDIGIPGGFSTQVLLENAITSAYTIKARGEAGSAITAESIDIGVETHGLLPKKPNADTTLNGFDAYTPIPVNGPGQLIVVGVNSKDAFIPDPNYFQRALGTVLRGGTWGDGLHNPVAFEVGEGLRGHVIVER